MTVLQQYLDVFFEKSQAKTYKPYSVTTGLNVPLKKY